MLEGNNSDGHAAKELNLLSLDTDGRAEPGHRELNDTYTDIPWFDLWYDCSVTDRDRQRIVVWNTD